MFRRLNISYFIIGSLLFFSFIPWVEGEYVPLYIVNLSSFILYFLVLNYTPNLKVYRVRYLASIVLLYSASLVAIFNMLSFSYEGNFFVFSETDAILYHDFAQEMNTMSWSYSIDYFLRYYRFDDLGMVLILSTVYSIVESNLLFNAFNIITGVITAIGIFRISRYLMAEKYAFICAISFSISSYFMWFHASGLKESIMVMLVVLFFDQFYTYTYSNKRKNIISASIFALALILFRPALMFFCLGAVGLGGLLQQKASFKKIVTSLVVIIIVIASFSYLEATFERFLKGGDMRSVLASKEATGMIKGSIPFSYGVNILAQLIGPLPTVIPGSDYLSFYSSGLIYRVLLAFPFWLGVYLAFRYKVRSAYPLIIFVLMEMISL